MEPPRVIWKGNEGITEEQSLAMDLAVKKRWEQDIPKGTWTDLDPCGLDVHLVFDRGDDDKLVLGAAASLNCRGERNDIAISTLGFLREGEKSTDKLFGVLTQLAIDSVGEAADRLGIWRAADEKILSTLNNGNRWERSQAVAECVRRELRTCQKGLAALVEYASPVGVEAVGALGILGDEAHLSLLARLTGSQDPETLLASLYAIRAIGTPEARRYLRGVAETHAEPGARSVAAQLVGEMKESH